uniref:Chromatin modification-related protein n=1 Tax=Blastobotrys adeninivorans TaxID=409370 RepID=A0A060TBQ3_BLAAD
MDAAAVLEQYVSDLGNLPAEMAHVLEEIGDRDVKFYETRKRIQQRDNQIHKFIKSHGSLADNPKEAQAYPKIRADFEKAMALQQQKVDLANTGLYIMAKQLKKLNDDVKRLENEGLLAPASELDFTSSELSSRQGSSRPSARPSSALSERQKKNSPQPVPSRGSTPASSTGRPPKRQKVSGAATPSAGPPVRAEDGDEEVLYCTCQRVSFGNMVACDNPDCQYEWFHYECVGLTSPPSGSWYCPPCSRALKRKR